jgi:hypothetical protein
MTGVSGINSMWWAAKGVQVTVMDDDEVRAGLISEVWRGLDLPFRMLCQKGFSSLPFDDNSFDMAWNFAALRFQSGVPAMLREMARVSKKQSLSVYRTGGISSTCSGIGLRQVNRVVNNLMTALRESERLWNNRTGNWRKRVIWMCLPGPT